MHRNKHIKPDEEQVLAEEVYRAYFHADPPKPVRIQREIEEIVVSSNNIFSVIITLVKLPYDLKKRKVYFK